MARFTSYKTGAVFTVRALSTCSPLVVRSLVSHTCLFAKSLSGRLLCVLEHVQRVSSLARNVPPSWAAHRVRQHSNTCTPVIRLCLEAITHLSVITHLQGLKPTASSIIASTDHVTRILWVVVASLKEKNICYLLLPKRDRIPRNSLTLLWCSNGTSGLHYQFER